MGRQIYCLTYSSFPFKDHWSYFIPSVVNPRIGTKIHVEGSVRAGFNHEIVRNYNLDFTHRTIHLHLLGEVPDADVHDTPSSGPLTIDTISRDNIERLALSVPAPGPSMNPTTGNAPPAHRVTFSDCQWWIRQVIVTQFVPNNKLPTNSIGILDAIPKN